MNFKNKDLNPSPSPQSPSAEFIHKVKQIYFLRQVNEVSIQEAGRIAEKMFEVLEYVEDYKVLSGEIGSEILDNVNIDPLILRDPKLKNYIKITGQLFKIANDSEIGAIKNLNREIVRDFDITAAALANCMGGGLLLDVLCDVVNEELSVRRPNAKTVASKAVAVFAGE